MTATLVNDRFHVPMPDDMPVEGKGMRMAILRIPWQERLRLGHNVEWRFVAEYHKKGQRYFVLAAESKELV